MILLLAYLFLALFVSFICSIMESVLLSMPQSFIHVQEQEGKKWAGILKSFKGNIDRPLSAILSLNTIAHTIGAAGVGAQAVKVFGEAYFGLISAILTVIILVLTEIIPKTIGAVNWRGLAGVAAYTIRAMIWITYPLVVVSALITRVFSSNHPEKSVSREEISALADLGAVEGVFRTSEYKIINNLLHLKNIRVKQVMTPRVVMVSVDEQLDLAQFIERKEDYTFSRIPVFNKNEDNIMGYVFRQRIFERAAEGKSKMKLAEMRREMLVFPNSSDLFTVWEHLLEKKEHIALIVDEYGGVDGIVTMEDIIESLLGLEIVDEKDTIEDMQKLALNKWNQRKSSLNILEDKAEPVVN